MLLRPARCCPAIFVCKNGIARLHSEFTNLQKGNQAVLLPDSSQITIRIRLDQKAADIARMARLGRQQETTTITNNKQQPAADEECLLFELCPDGQKLPISGAECSVPTMLSPGSILFSALPSESGRTPVR